MMFMSVTVMLVIFQATEAEDVLYYEDIQSEELKEQFDQLPLISRTVTKSEWCEVIVAGVTRV